MSESFIFILKKKGLSQRSQARVISSLRTYFKFCEGLGEESPELRELRPPKVNVNLPRAITMNEYEALQKASEVKDPYKTARNHITLLLLLGTGCRVSELIALNLIDFMENRVCYQGGWQRREGTSRAFDIESRSGVKRLY